LKVFAGRFCAQSASKWACNTVNSKQTDGNAPSEQQENKQ